LADVVAYSSLEKLASPEHLIIRPVREEHNDVALGLARPPRNAKESYRERRWRIECLEELSWGK
jgi:hypothetical protein